MLLLDAIHQHTPKSINTSHQQTTHSSVYWMNTHLQLSCFLADCTGAAAKVHKAVAAWLLVQIVFVPHLRPKGPCKDWRRPQSNSEARRSHVSKRNSRGGAARVLTASEGCTARVKAAPSTESAAFVLADVVTVEAGQTEITIAA